MNRKISRRNQRHQKVYKMKGCSKKTRKNHLSGGGADINLAYPHTNIPSVTNPFLAYIGKGGASYAPVGGLTSLTPPTQNINAADKTIPSTGPPSIGWGFLNSQVKRGGCGCGIPFLSGGKNKGNRRGKRTQKKGGCGPLCTSGFMGGRKTHRSECRCSECKMTMQGGNVGIPYPNGLVGSPWTPATSGWPGVNGIPGDRNYIAPNDYIVDPQTAMIATGANPPFSVGGRRTRRQRGGNTSNFLTQDLINLGRQFQFGVGSAYNALAGYQAPVNPNPWTEQLSNTPNLSTVRAANL